MNDISLSPEERSVVTEISKLRHFKMSWLDATAVNHLGSQGAKTFKKNLTEKGYLVRDPYEHGFHVLHWEKTRILLNKHSLSGRLFKREEKEEDAAKGSFVAKIHPAIRWVTFLPISVVATGLVLTFWRGIFQGSVERQIGGPIEENGGLLSGNLGVLAIDGFEMYIAALAFVALGAFIAPRYQLVVAGTLLMIATAIVSVSVSAGIFYDVGIPKDRLVASLIGLIAGGITSLYGIHHTLEESRKGNES
ncbi:MAG: hypothetical protein Q8Q11_03200 [bacterium]|nr:hypothetical protein [bacterium]